MPERVPKTVPAQLQLELNPDAPNPPIDLHASLSAVRILLERQRHSGLYEETAMTALVSRNPTNAAPTRYTPDTPALTIRRRDNPLEAVSSKSGEFRLLHTHARSELTEISLHKNARLILTPAGTAVETFYLISGQLSGELAGEPCVFGQGDTIVTENLSEPLALIALVGTRMLYFTEQPQFHTFSERLGELKQLAVEVELKDGYTAGHCERLQELSYQTGVKLGLSTTELHRLAFGAYLHDVGKIRVPLVILNKPGKLMPDEWSVIKKHPEYGRELLSSTSMHEAGTIVEQHHERFDGSGYPYGLAGNDILVEAAIVAVADTFDAMTTTRPYRAAVSPTEALAEIHRHANIHYPEEIVSAFSLMISEKNI